MTLWSILLFNSLSEGPQKAFDVARKIGLIRASVLLFPAKPASKRFFYADMSHFRKWLDSLINPFNVIACNLYAGLFLLLWLVSWSVSLFPSLEFLIYQGELPTRSFYGAFVFAWIVYAVTLFALAVFKRYTSIVVLLTASIAIWVSLHYFIAPESLNSNFNLVGFLTAFLTHALLSRMVHCVECAFEEYYSGSRPLDLPLMVLTVVLLSLDSKSLFWSSDLTNSANFVSFVHKLYLLTSLTIVLPFTRLSIYDIERELAHLNRQYIPYQRDARWLL